jgi:hypothetical protein
MVVRYTETNGQMEIEIPDFVNDCLAYKLPMLLPNNSTDELKVIGDILHENLMKVQEDTGEPKGDDAAKNALLEKGFLFDQPTFEKLKLVGDDICFAIVGLGMDMIEPDAPQRVRWSV